MMTTGKLDLDKLDDGLARLLKTPYVASSELIPIAVLSRPGSLEQVTAKVRACGGTVRHLLTPLNAVSAWVPMQAIQSLSGFDGIVGIEMDQAMHIA